MDITRELANHAIELSFDNLPEDVIEAAQKVILDTLGSTLAGTTAAGIDTLRSLATEWGGRGESSLLAFGDKVPAPSAVWVNAAAARARDIDEVHEKAVLHSAISVLPPALAVAEWLGHIDGKALIAAMVVGMDLIARLGLSVHQNPNVSGISSTWQMGVFGACAAAGRLMGLNSEQMNNAFGIAYSQTAGNQQAIIEGTLMIRIMQGVTARNGLMAAILAKRGIDGPKAALQGKFGYFPVFHRNEYDPTTITRDLGSVFEITNSSLKPFPCCKATHAAVSCALGIRSEYGISPEQIDRIRVKVNQSTFNLVCNPLESKKRPSTIAEAQFSLPYCLAVAVEKGDVFLDDFSPEAIQRAGVLTISDRVQVEVDEGIERRAGRYIGPAALEVTTKDGGRYTADVEFVKGHPKNPMTMAEVEEKFTKCAAFAAKPIPSEKQSEVKRIVGELETCPDVSQLVILLR